MRKNFFGLGVIFAIALIAGCSSTSEKEKEKEPVAECTFPDAPTIPAPEWICNETDPAVKVAAVGSAEMSKAGYGFTEQMASTAARVKLAQQMQVQVQNMIKQYAEATGSADAETVDKVNTSVTKQITDKKLVGSKIIKKRTSPNKVLYVLVGLDASSVQSIAKDAVQTSLDNENALWQQFKAKQGQDELAESISNQ